MEILFWASVLLLTYPYAGYPLLLWMLSRVWGKSPRRGDVTPKVTLLISAYNEESVIAKKIENSLALDYPHENLEIVVASESNDRTNEIVGRYAARGVKLHAFQRRRGKAAMLFATVPQVEGEIIVFSDANALYDRDAVRKLVRNFADPRIGCVSGRLEYLELRPNSAGASESLYWRYEMWIKRLESVLFSLLGANGSIFALRKQLYAPLSKTRGDDFELSVGVLLRGAGTILEPEAVSRETASETTQAEFRRHRRIAGMFFTSGLLLAREAVERGVVFVLFQLISHRVLRWLAVLFLIALLVSSAMLKGSFYTLVFWLQLLFYLLALVGWALDARGATPLKLFRLPYYFCAIHFAVFLGVAGLFFSPSVVTWEKVR